MNFGQEQVLKYLKKHKRAGITAIDALNKLGIMRLGGRIHELREMGFDIETVEEKGKNRYGHTVRYVRYILK